MLHLNKPALVIGGGSFAGSLVIAAALGWMNNSRQDGYFLVMAGAALMIIDLVYRMRELKDVYVPPPPTILTADGWVPTRPQPVTKALNLLLSGEKGAQFFWVLPGWIAGMIVTYFSIAAVLKAR